MKKIYLKISVIALTIFGFSFSLALAFQIEKLNISADNTFVLGPGTIDELMEPGQKITKEITITNRLGRTMNFKVEVEDVMGAKNPEAPVVFLGEEKGPYSLKDYVKPEISDFTLESGQRMILPVEISIPQDAEPGGLYGGLSVSTNPPVPEGSTEAEKAKGQIQLISRLRANLLIRVKGEVKEEGALKDFSTLKKYYEKGPISLQILYENTGRVHVNPYGIIEIKNIFGKKVDEIEVKSYFVLPDAIRMREVKWDRGLLFGRYTASLSLNRGYKDIIDQKSISFWVIPWKIILVGLLILIVLISFFIWIASHFELRRKKKPENKEQKSEASEK